MQVAFRPAAGLQEIRKLRLFGLIMHSSMSARMSFSRIRV